MVCYFVNYFSIHSWRENLGQSQSHVLERYDFLVLSFSSPRIGRTCSLLMYINCCCSGLKVLSIALLSGYPFFANLRGTTLSIVVDLASALKNVLSVCILSSSRIKHSPFTYRIGYLHITPVYATTLSGFYFSLLVLYSWVPHPLSLSTFTLSNLRAKVQPIVK